MGKPVRWLLAAAGVSLVCACASVQWSYSRQGPAIPELGAVRALGIAVFDPVLKSNEHLLIKVGGAFYNPIDLDGVTAKVALLVLAPDAASRFAVNRENISRACRDVWESEIGTVRRFDYALSRGAERARMLGQTADGEPIPTGYDTVRAVPDRVSRGGASPAAISELCRRYGVEALLVVEPAVYAEVGQVSSQPSDHAVGKVIDPGNFILRAQVSYEYVLYDGVSGGVITDSARSRPRYDTRQPPETWIVDLGPSHPKAIMGFLKSPGFLAALSQSLREAARPWICLFRSCMVAVPENQPRPAVNPPSAGQ